MKFLKKQALATSLSSFSHDEALYITETSTFTTYSYCSQYFTKLARTLRHWLNPKLIHTLPNTVKIPHAIDWAPVVKVSTRISQGEVQGYYRYHNDRPLLGQSILCVGGRIRFYPQYERLIRNCGGRFISFHGDENDRSISLQYLMNKADMIICPIDCVNHDDYLMLKRYCKRSGKRCVLLDRSQVKTFTAGVHMLIYLAAAMPDKQEKARLQSV